MMCHVEAIRINRSPGVRIEVYLEGGADPPRWWRVSEKALQSCTYQQVAFQGNTVLAEGMTIRVQSVASPATITSYDIQTLQPGIIATSPLESLDGQVHVNGVQVMLIGNKAMVEALLSREPTSPGEWWVMSLKQQCPFERGSTIMPHAYSRDAFMMDDHYTLRVITSYDVVVS